MSHLQMKNGVKYQIFVRRKLRFGQLLVTCTEFAMSSYGKFTGHLLSNKHFYQVPYQVRTKARYLTTVLEKFELKMFNTRQDRETFIFYKFNSKGDNLKQVECLIEFEAVCLVFLIK